MEERNIAVAAPGPHEENFIKWGIHAVGEENTIVWATQRELLSKLTAACKDGQCCIKNLYIFSHGGIYGLPQEWEQSVSEARTFLRDLYEHVRAGKIVFCKKGVIYMTGCRSAATEFPAVLATISGCLVKAPSGMAYPKPADEGSPFQEGQPGWVTGEWLSGDGRRIPDEDKKGYLGWMEYTGVNIAGQRIGEQLAAPANAWLIRLW